MKLLRMTATFGRLEQETLSLTEGLNVLQMPNEAGKSTWAEFLLAMLYGVDTSEREKTGVLPVKTKYQPWSGKPMEGVIELEHAGRRITLTRTSTARAPLGVFSAVYTDSGLPVEGMTGANCGETLLGVPKRVYQRSAFVRQAGLGLTPDDELEARLSALVTTGDEAVSFTAADKRLLAWQNRVRHNKTGLIPDAERELAAVDSALAALAGEHEKNLALRAQLQSLQAQQTACEEDLRALQAAQAQRKTALRALESLSRRLRGRARRSGGSRSLGRKGRGARQVRIFRRLRRRALKGRRVFLRHGFQGGRRARQAGNRAAVGLVQAGQLLLFPRFRRDFRRCGQMPVVSGSGRGGAFPL